MPSLPTPGKDRSVWGQELVDWLLVGHNNDGSLKVGDARGNYTLGADTLVGATSLTFSTAPAGFAQNCIVMADQGTSECELRVGTISGSSVTFTTPLRYAHAKGDRVSLLVFGTVHPSDFGCSSADSDSWQGLQRMVLECVETGARVVGGGSSFGATYNIAQPLGIPSGTDFERISFSTANWANAALKDTSRTILADLNHPQRVWAMPLSNKQAQVSAVAATDTFTCPSGNVGGFDTSNYSQVMFNAPRGETLPGGIVAGKIYYVKSNTGTTQFTISDTPGGPTLDITSDGTAHMFMQVGALARFYFRYLRLNLNVNDVCGLYLNTQQPQAGTDLRVDMNATYTTEGIGCYISGQLGYFERFEINPFGTKTTGLALGGYGIVVRDFNCAGGGTSSTGALLFGVNCGLEGEVWLEATQRCGIEIAGGRGLRIGNVMQSGATSHVFVSAGVDCNYHIEAIHNISGGNTLMFWDFGKGAQLYSDSGSNPGTGESDYRTTIYGLTYLYNPYNEQAIQFGHRMTRTVTGAYTVRYIDEMVFANPTGGAFTVTLPTAAHWNGHTTTIKNVRTSGTNAVTVATTGGQTIDGMSTISLANRYDSLTVRSDGTNWVII